MSRRLNFGVDSDGRVVVSPSSERRCVSLRLSFDGAAVFMESLTAVTLPWDSYGSVRSVADGAAPNGWSISYFAAGRGGYKFGVVVRVSGQLDIASRDLYKASMSTWRRFNTWFENSVETGHALPIVPRFWAFGACERERDTLSALTAVLARRPDLRAALADPARVRALVHDLGRGLLKRPVERTGARRDTIDTIYVLHDLGFVHPFGRPLPGEQLPSLQEVVARTHARLDASPYRRDRSITDDAISAIARKTFIDVQPWPFGALTS